MANDEFGDKTEQPTDHRRSEARQKGNVARSQDLSAAGVMLGVALALAIFGTTLIVTLGRLIRTYLGGVETLQLSLPFVTRQLHDIVELLAGSILPIMLLMLLTALVFNVMQVGFLVSTESLQPQISRLNPLSGAKRILSIASLVKLAVSLGKLGVVTLVAALFIRSVLPKLLLMSGQEPVGIAMGIKQMNVTLAFELALALVALAIIDFAFQKWKHEQDLRMSKQEVREEMKQMEGDPLIRQRRREAHQKLAQARELKHVEKADVIITNPTHIAVAIKYDPQTMPAPTIVAKGMGEIAARIRRIAVEHDIPIIERKPLARALYQSVKVGQNVPVEMYEVFVEIMAYVYRLSGRTPPGLS